MKSAIIKLVTIRNQNNNNLEKKKMVLIDYVGSKIYSQKKFVAEASRIGTSRSYMVEMLISAQLDFNSQICFANWKSNSKVTKEEREVQGLELFDNSTSKMTKLGKCEIFGYSRINGMNLPEDIAEDLKEKLKGKGVLIGHRIMDIPEEVERECGEYTITGALSFQLTAEFGIKEFYDILKELKEEHGKFKILITGEFVELEKPIVLNNQKFSRSLLNLKNESIANTIPSEDFATINFISGYKQCLYVDKDGNRQYEYKKKRAKKGAEKNLKIDSFMKKE